MSAKICERCGASSPEEARFCIACGAMFPVTCGKCRKPLLKDAKFCMECGTPAGALSYERKDSDVSQPSSYVADIP